MYLRKEDATRMRILEASTYNTKLTFQSVSHKITGAIRIFAKTCQACKMLTEKGTIGSIRANSFVCFSPRKAA